MLSSYRPINFYSYVMVSASSAMQYYMYFNDKKVKKMNLQSKSLECYKQCSHISDFLDLVTTVGTFFVRP